MAGLHGSGAERVSWWSQSWGKRRSNFLENVLPVKTSQELLDLKKEDAPTVKSILEGWASEQYKLLLNLQGSWL